ncbi:MAG: carboxypeptidase-like regulatory domain-containing protein [Taibaiella sp.]|nr:carboxypeptidase-like regulatory domain-containing protein [Taibaiella sp.]
MRFLLIFFISCFAVAGLNAQLIVASRVFDLLTHEPIPFATIKYGAGNQGVIAGIDGAFEIPATGSTITKIEVSCLGYRSATISLPLSKDGIFLEPIGNELSEVTIKPPIEKIRRILNAAIDNRPANNPDKYDQYSCHVYYKMKADMQLPDTSKNDTAARARKLRALSERQHLLMSETYSVRHWERPGKLQEDVLATRFSGLQKAVFTSMVTDILPFHAYDDFIKLNGKDYFNPVSPGFERRYRFNLSDEIMDGTDTIWVLSFRPKGISGASLSGKVFIHSDGYAIDRIIARARDTALKQSVRIEHQYARVPIDNGRRWFPRQLNYVIDREMKSDKFVYELRITGNSVVDSALFSGIDRKVFDKRHTVRISDQAMTEADSLLRILRPDALTDKERTTYRVIDSLGRKIKADRMMGHMRNLPLGRLSFGPVDVDLARILAFNKYEQVRLGLGGQTNDKLLKWLSLGGWGGYGFGDKRWKYGAFGELYLDKYKEFVVRGGYSDDISDPGRIQLAKDLDKNYLRMFLLQRADHVQSYTGSIRKKLGYWNLEAAGAQQHIEPLYSYALLADGVQRNKFDAQEASLSLRYAYAERTAPVFGSYVSLGSQYPICYGKVTYGTLESGSMMRNYVQALAAVKWKKHINRIGTEQLMLEGGKIWSDDALPISKLFAGNGYRYSAKGFLSLYAFGGLTTMFPYEYYTDQFVQAIVRHDFDWKLYRLEAAGVPFSSAPNIGLQYGMLYGTLQNKAAHLYVPFAVPDKPYHEAGIILNGLLRQRSSTYYQSLNIGYFYHFTPGAIDFEKNGKLVIGVSVEL